MHENKVFYTPIFIFVFFLYGCCTTRTAPTAEIDRNFTDLQNRIIELENRNKGLEEEIGRLTSENKYYADYYKQATAGIGTNIDSAIESTDRLDERINRLFRENFEFERILRELTNQNSSDGDTNLYTNQSNHFIK